MMNVRHLSWLMFIGVLLLQGSAQEQELELDQDVEMTNVTKTLPMDVKMTTNLQHETEPEATSEAVPEVAEPETVKPAETEPETETKTESDNKIETATELIADLPMTTTAMPAVSTHPPDYQDDAAPQEPTTPEMAQVATTTAAAVNITVPRLPNICFSCMSDRNGSCQQYPHERQVCPLNGKRFGCYTMLKRDTKLIWRGCTSDLTKEAESYCYKEPKLCVFCAGAMCNRDAAPQGGSTQLVGSLTVWSLVCLVASLAYFL